MEQSSDSRINIIRLEKESNINFRQRRHPDWTENYLLYRDRVITNRLTQRQSVNIPIMKYSIKSLLKDVDEPPLIYYGSLENDDHKEMIYNEVWKDASRRNKIIIKDIIDKKQVFLFGRSFKKLNIVNGRFFWEIIDPQDMLVSRYVDPSTIDSSRSLIHQHIFKPISVLDQNDFYDKSKINELRAFFATDMGLFKAMENARDAVERGDRMRAMGVPDVDNPVLGEVYVELNEVYMYKYDPAKEKEVIYLTVMAEDTHVLAEAPLYELIGETVDSYWDDHYPFTSWGDDYDRTDFWSDSIADTLRPINRVVNAWFSQLVENRTLRNFGMNYYDATTSNFTPQTFAPVPWGWYPVPGNPSEMIKNVEIPDLKDSLEEIQFLMTIAEKATGATATQQGQLEQRKVTRGEIQLALQNAKERVKSMAVFYNDSWEEFGLKYTKMIEAAPDLLDNLTLVRKGKNGNGNYPKLVKPDDYLSKHGYTIEIKQVADKSQEDIESIQKLNAARSIMPNNKPLDDIYKKKILEFSGCTMDEVTKILEAEKQNMQQQNPPLLPPTANGGTGNGSVSTQTTPAPMLQPN